MKRASHTTVRHCAFLKSRRGIVAINGKDIEISECKFVGNIGRAPGGAIFASDLENVKINNNTFKENTASKGGVICLSEINNVTIINCFF